MARLLVFGDSVAYGKFNPKGSWTQKLREILTKNFSQDNSIKYYDIYDLSIPGDATEEVLSRFDSEAKHRARKGSEDIIIFAIGINDSVLLKNGDPRVTVAQFKQNLERLISKAREYVNNVVFLGLTAVDETKTHPVIWNSDRTHTNERIMKFEVAIEEICQTEKIPFIPIFDNFSQENYKDLLIDGVHPNPKGQEKIFQLVKKGVGKITLFNGYL